MTQDEIQKRIEELNTKIEELYIYETDDDLFDESIQIMAESEALCDISNNVVNDLKRIIYEGGEMGKAIIWLCKCYNMQCNERNNNIKKMSKELERLEEEKKLHTKQ